MGTTSITSTIPSISFDGISSYAGEFESIIQKAVDNAEIPMQALQTQVTDNQNASTALGTLSTAVGNVATDITALGTLATGQGLTASSSDSNAISVENVSASTPANYTISNITVATAASETSNAKYTDATTAPVWVAGQTQFQLVVGSNTYNLNLTGNDSLTGLENAITSSGAPVTASIINTGSGDYLTLTANNVGATTLQLNGIPQQASLLTSTGTGTETSLYGYSSATTTPVSNSGTVDLSVGGGSAIQLNVSGANNNLTGLMNAINNANAGVTATITTSNGQSYLQVTDPSGPTSITLNDMPPVNTTSLITNTGTGTETSLNGYASATTTTVSSTGTVDLSVGGGSAIQLNVSGANNNLTGLMNAINNANAGVTASITTSDGMNYLQITDPSGPTSITLNDQDAPSPVNLISDSDQGTNASFTLNNNIQVTNQATNTFNSVIPGVSFTLQQNDSGSVTISLSADPSQLANALQNLTTDYNTLMTDVNQQIGSNAGPLAGNTIIDTISDDLRQLTAYWLSNSTSSVRSLSDLGVTFDDTTGQMSYDASVVDNFDSSQMADAFKFLGSSNSGFAALASNFTQVSDPATGMIEVEQQGYQTDDTNLNNEISTDEDQITTLQTNMTTQLEAADALVDQLQSEQSQVQAEVESVDYVDFGAPLNSNTT